MSIPSGNRAGKKQLEVWPTSLFLFRQNAHRKGNRYIVKKEKRTTILRFYSFTKGLRHNFVLALLTMAISVFAGYMTPQIIRVTVDSVINDSPFNLPSFLATQIENMGGRDFLRQNLILCALASLLFAVLAGISTYLSRMNMAKGCEGTVTKIRNTLFSHIQRLPYAWHNKNQTGDIIQRCTQDVDLIHNFINDQMMELVRVVFLIVVSLVLMFSMNAKLALIAFIFIPIVVGYSMIFFVIVGDRFRIADEAEGKLTAMVQENLTGVRVVRAFGRERFEKDKFNKQNDLFSDLWVRLGHVMGVNWGIGDLLSGIQVLTIIAAGIVFVVDGAITEGEYLAFVAYNSMLVWPTRSLGRLLSELSKTGISSKRIFEILDAEPEKDAETPVTPPMDRDIVFKHVNFSYGTSGEVLHDIDLKIPAGTTLGILGSTGSGKSFAAKRELLNVFLAIPQDRIIVVDPMGEYAPLVERLGGQVIEIAPDSPNHISPMDVQMDMGSGDSPLSLKADFLLSLCELVVGGRDGLQPIEKTVIDRCVRQVYRELALGLDKAKTPLLQDLYEELLRQPEPEAKRIATALELYCTGSLNLFNHPTNVNLNSRVVCFVLKGMGENLRKIAMHITNDFVTSAVGTNFKNGVATWCYFDEFHILLRDPLTASYFVTVWKMLRKQGCVPSALTQNVKDLLASREIENILDNTDFMILLSQAQSDRAILAKQIGISEHQLSYITQSNSGEGLLFYGSVTIPFVDRFPRGEIYDLLTTKPEDAANGKQTE